MHLSRLRWLGAAFCALAMLCVTTHASALVGATAHARIDVNASADITRTASASEAALPKDRVWGFDQNSPLHVWILRSATLEQPSGISPTLPETASVSSYAAKAAEKAIVAASGTKITGYTTHGLDRAIGDGAKRAGTNLASILDALKDPKSIKSGVDALGRPFEVFNGGSARVVVNPETGKIVSVNPIGGAGVR